MKKDYLEEGAMADTADLVVLGAYYGTGNKGKDTCCQLSKVVNGARVTVWKDEQLQANHHFALKRRTISPRSFGSSREGVANDELQKHF